MTMPGSQGFDYLILMGYDEHWSTGDPGPIASYHWFSTRFASTMRGVDPSQTIVAIGNYGYDWTSGVKEAQVLTFPEVMQRAQKMNATVELDPASLNPSYSYRSEGKTHQVWFLNSASAYYQLQAANSYRPAGYALWRLGAKILRSGPCYLMPMVHCPCHGQAGKRQSVPAAGD